MNSDAKTVSEYLSDLPNDRKEPMKKLRECIINNLPKDFEEQMAYRMIAYVVPLSIYPKGYHASPGEPLPFMSLASQKSYISFYHMGIYAKPEVEEWFREEYKKRVSTKLDMGKSCIRFKKIDQIPYDLIEELCQKITVDEYIAAYEASFNKQANQ